MTKDIRFNFSTREQLLYLVLKQEKKIKLLEERIKFQYRVIEQQHTEKTKKGSYNSK